MSVLERVDCICEAVPDPCSGPPWTQQITGRACRISPQPDLQIDNGFLYRPVMAHT